MSSIREEGVLKLVHPGRRVEIHIEPIMAAQVLNKYPRHCIARPDVFKFPWIVVRPEAVLHPGKVFYIVPKKTIYHLLKAKKQQNQHMPLAIPHDFTCISRSQTSLDLLRENQNVDNSKLKEKHQFQKNDVNRSLSDWNSWFEGNQSMRNPRNLPLKSTAGMTPKHLRHGKHRSRYENSPWYEEEDFKENRNGSLENYSHQSIHDSSFDTTFMHSKRYYYSSISYSPTSRLVNRHRHYTISSNQIELKSCLRKPDSERWRLNLRVTFLIAKCYYKQ